MRLYNAASSFCKWGFWSQQVVIHLACGALDYCSFCTLCHVHLQNEDQRDDRLEVITDDDQEAEEGGDGREASMVRMALEHIMGFWNLVQLFLYLGTCLRLKFSLGPLSWYLQHMLPALPSLVLLLFVNSYCPTPSPIFASCGILVVMSNSIIFAFNFDTSLWLNHTRIYDLK